MNNLNVVGECDLRVAKTFFIHCFPFMEKYADEQTCQWDKENNFLFIFGSIVCREGDRWYEKYPTDIIADDDGEVDLESCDFAIDIYGSLETLLIGKVKRQFQHLIDEFFLDVVNDGKIKPYSSKFECAKRGFKYTEGDMYLGDEDDS